MSALVDLAIEKAGLAGIAQARRSGDFARLSPFEPALHGADLLALGALADRIRAEEVGDVVRIFTTGRPEGGGPPAEIARRRDGDDVAFGLGLLRRVATDRILGPRAARVRVDWMELGLELAQVALGFGANELVGLIANRRGLPIAEGSQQKVKGVGLVATAALKKKELVGLLERAGRRAVFVDDPLAKDNGQHADERDPYTEHDHA